MEKKYLILALGIFLLIGTSLKSQDSIFAQKTKLLDVEENSWYETFMPLYFNDDDKLDFTGGNTELKMYLSSDFGDYERKDLGWIPDFPIKYMDFDNDSLPDILCAGNYYYKNMGNDSLALTELGISGWDKDFADYGDIDNDGYVDALVLQPITFEKDKLMLYFAHGDNTYDEVILDNSLSSYGYKQLIDINGDGLLDIGVINGYSSTNIMLFTNNGDRTFTKLKIENNIYNNTNCFNLVDLDNDGDKDILLSGFDSDKGLYVMENIDGTFSNEMKINNQNQLFFKSEDIDFDGDFDIVFLAKDGNNFNISYQLNDGEMNFSNPQIIGSVIGYNYYFNNSEIYKNWFSLIDVDGDGVKDILLNAPADKEIVWFKNTTVVAKPTELLAQPISQNVCENDSVTFTIEATGTNLTYHWQKDVVDISGATADSYTIDAASSTDAGEYKCVVTGDGGTVTSKGAILSIKKNTSITKQPQSVQICEGKSASFGVEATGENLAYQWQKDGVDISGATSADYTIATVSVPDAGKYVCMISGECGALQSAEATLTIDPLIVIDTQPQSADISRGKQAKFTVSATGTISGYQWQKDGVALNDGGKYTGTTTAELTISDVAQSEEGNYTVMISGDCGNVTSDTATLLVITATIDLAKAGITIIPNPTHDYIHIINTGKNIDQIAIYSITGKKTLQKSKDFDRIDLSMLQSGVYFVKVVQGRDVVVDKVVVE